MPSYERNRHTSSYSTHASKRFAKVKRVLLPAGKFCALVVCSALLSSWMQQQWNVGEGKSKLSALKRYGRKNAAVPEGETTASTESSDPTPVVGKMEDLYRKHLEEIFHTLRTNPSVRMVKMKMPALILNYQRNLASLDDGSTLRLQAKGSEVPVIAISLTSRRFLEQMLITYIDPKTIPPRLISSTTLPFNPKMLPQFLIVPDLSGGNANAFVFEKK